jgi:hypothetical protein
MVKTKLKTIEEIFSKTSPEDKEIAERLRALIKGAVPDAEEMVRQGRITYEVDMRDFAAIRLAKGHVDLLFMQGDRLSSALLKGTGSLGDPRHMEVYSFKNFNEKEAKRLLKEAAAITEQTGKT